ncbi:MAG: sodium:solute symporter family protein [Bacteroidota bacterium]
MNMVHLSFSDIAIIFLYFAAVIVIGFRAKKKSDNDDDFFLAGRSLTLPLFVMTLVSTWYGGILGVGEFYYRYGIFSWVIQGIPYYFFASIFALFLAKKIRTTNFYSIPDKLASSYDAKTALLSSFLTFILMTPAAYIVMLSTMLQMIFGWSVLLSLTVTSLVAISYLYSGGFRADVQTDVLEFMLMFLGFAILLPFCFSHFGGIAYLQKNLPQTHLALLGGNSLQYLFVWFFIALWTLVDPAFHQRCYAAKDEKTAQKGIFISILFWFIFDALTATAGLYARASIPDLQQPLMAYPMLAEKILPPIAKGLFYVGMLATIMSTLNTLAFVSAQTLGRDIFLRMKKSAKPSTENTQRHYSSSKRATQIGLLVSFAFSICIALLIPSVIEIWYTIGTVIIPGLLIPLMASYFERWKISARFAFLSMLCGWLVSLGWMIAGLHTQTAFLNIEPLYPGLAVSFFFWMLGRITQRRNAS